MAKRKRAKKSSSSIGDLFQDLPPTRSLNSEVPRYYRLHQQSSVAELECLIADEAKFKVQTAPLIVGVDEAGRGPWAGPVVAAAVILPASFGLKQVSIEDPFYLLINDIFSEMIMSTFSTNND